MSLQHHGKSVNSCNHLLTSTGCVPVGEVNLCTFIIHTHVTIYGIIIVLTNCNDVVFSKGENIAIKYTTT